jgi:hypothetical protein
MRTLLAASTCALFLAVPLVLSACAPSDPTFSEEASSTSEALAIKGAEVTPPPTKKKIALPPVHGGNVGVYDPGPCSGKVRFDLRRATRSCEDLPGAYVEGGVTFVPGNGGRFRVGRLLAGTAAPAALQDKACSFTWEPTSCAPPDKAKLLLVPEPGGERLQERTSACLNDPAACKVVATFPGNHTPARFFIPNGPGRCEVCGYASNRSLFVVLPPSLTGFDYRLAGEPVRYVYLDAQTLSEEPSVIEVQLDHDVVDQDVSIDQNWNDW